ncbi:hypothetical protein HJ588_04495 [Flexivirga sp. ID2601S]|uniref:DUF4386 domain-containing protein n=1 Tax=Flexivirga aerilata TaxID=1656889 RepID=A0A849ADF2_9MICO|nr:hypothetical protein [Flexivirga aerilata]NNG38535.1 hypothetical protein [Flexivirga aerilata]
MATHRNVGIFGLIASALIVLQVPLYFLYDGAPPDANILTRSLIGIVGCTFYIVFFTGLRSWIGRHAPALDWPANVMQLTGLAWAVVVFVPQSMEVGAAIATRQDIDTTTEGPYAPAQYLLQGGVSRLLMAAFLIAFAVILSRSQLLPRWVGRSAIVLAAVNLAFLPAVYFGDNAADFYSAQGWGTTATMGLVWSLWTLAVSVAMVRQRAVVRPGSRSVLAGR